MTALHEPAPAAAGDRSAPVLRVDGLVLRPYEDRDAPAFTAAVHESMEALGRWMPWCHPAYSEQDALDWFAVARAAAASNGAHEFGIFTEETAPGRPSFVGGIGLNLINRQHAFCNLGYWIRQSMQRQRIASRCVRAVARYGFEQLGLWRIEIVVAEGNEASAGVARTAGARLECVARNRLLLDGASVPASMFSLVPDEPIA